MYAITDRLAERLAKARFRVRTGEELGALPVRFVASKTIFVPTALCLMSVHVVVLENDSARPHDIDNLFDIGFKFAKRINKIPLLRGMQFGYVVMPLIIGKVLDRETLLYAATSPSYRFALMEFPIVIDLMQCRVVFFEGFTKVGSAVLPSVQDIVTKHIEPVVDEGCS